MAVAEHEAFTAALWPVRPSAAGVEALAVGSAELDDESEAGTGTGVGTCGLTREHLLLPGCLGPRIGESVAPSENLAGRLRSRTLLAWRLGAEPGAGHRAGVGGGGGVEVSAREGLGTWA